MKRSFSKISAYLMTVLIVAVSVSGCDFFRSIAGRPTSAEIEIKRQMIAAQQAEHQAMIDSVRKVEKQIADSLALIDSLQKKDVTVLNPSKLGGLYTEELNRRYYIIVGSFMDKNNAQRKLTEMKNKGHMAEIISFKNGYTAVGICPTDKKAMISDSLARLLSVGAIDKQSWILENN